MSLCSTIPEHHDLDVGPSRCTVLVNLSVVLRSIGLPVAGKPAIVVCLRDLELDRVKTHCDSKVDPPPHVASCISALIRPPLSSNCAAVRTISTGEVLHQQTCVNCNDDAGAEPCQEAKDLGCLIVIVQAGLLGQSSGPAFSYGRNDARCCVHDEDSIGERDDNGRRNGHDSSDHKVEPSVDDGGQ